MSKGAHKTEKGVMEEELKKPDAFYGVRHTQVILLFVMLVIAYGMRVNLSVAIVAMTDPEASSNPDIPTYEWDNNSTILSSFFWGYVIPQIVAGLLAKKYGPRWLIIGAMIVCSIFTILIPIMADSVGSFGVMACRMVQGFAQGFIFPSTHSALSRWAPLPERSRIGSFVYTGGPFGTVLAMPITGWISASSVGWPCVFYLYGAIGLIWVVFYFFLGSNSPASHKSISAEEKYYIEKSLGHEDGHSTEPTPWRHILTSAPVWAVLIAHCGQNWGFWTLLTEIPTYMNYVMKYDIKSNGVLSAAPYFALFVLGFVFSPTTDLLISKKIISLTIARKIMNSIGMLIPAAALVVLALAAEGEDQKGLVLGLLVTAVGFNAAIFSGFNVNHIDLSPNHSGFLMGITNGISNISGILAPLAVQFIVTDEEDLSQWRVVFLIASGVYLAADAFYVIFGSGEKQCWDSFADAKKEASNKQKNQA